MNKGDATPLASYSVQCHYLNNLQLHLPGDEITDVCREDCFRGQGTECQFILIVFILFIWIVFKDFNDKPKSYVSVLKIRFTNTIFDLFVYPNFSIQSNVII